MLAIVVTHLCWMAAFTTTGITPTLTPHFCLLATACWSAPRSASATSSDAVRTESSSKGHGAFHAAMPCRATRRIAVRSSWPLLGQFLASLGCAGIPQRAEHGDLMLGRLNLPLTFSGDVQHGTQEHASLLPPRAASEPSKSAAPTSTANRHLSSQRNQ